VIAENPFMRVLFGIAVEDFRIVNDDIVVVVKSAVASTRCFPLSRHPALYSAADETNSS